MEADANSEAFDFLKSGSESIFHKTWGRDVKAEAMEAVKFLWKRKWKHFEEAGSENKLGSD